MDAQKQHEFVGNNEDRSRSIYCNMRKVQNTVSHTQYFLQDRTPVSVERNRLCRCAIGMPDNVKCKECRETNSADKIWSTSSHMNMSYKNMETPKNLEKSPLYLHSDISTASYWSEKASSFPEESLIGKKTTLEPIQNFNLRAYGKVYNVDQAAYEIPPQVSPPHQSQTQSQIRSLANIGYCKERFFDDKYSYKHDTRSLNVMYAPSSSVFSSSMDSCAPELNTDAIGGLRPTTIDNRAMNSTSIRSTSNNDQHQITNFVRKCPQTCDLEVKGSTYSNLYMSAPQFSSEKFSSVQPEKNVECITHSNSDMNYRNDSLKMCERPFRPSASPLPFTTQNKYSPVVNEQIHHFMPQPAQVNMQHQQQHTTFSRNSPAIAQPVQYIPFQGPAQDHPNNAPSVCKKSQSFDHYQYLRNSNSFPSMSIAPVKIVPGLSEYSSKEDTSLNSGAGGNSGNGLFLNPYNAPSLPKSCCKGSAPLTTVISNLHPESLHETSKCIQTFDKAKSALDIPHNNQQCTAATISTPPLVANSSTHHFRRQTICCESTRPKCLKMPLFGAESSKIAAVSSATNGAFPAQLPTSSHILPTSLPSHQKVYDRHYAPQYTQSYSHQLIEERQQAIPKITRKNSIHIGNSGPFDNQIQPPHHMPCYSASRTLQTANTALSPAANSNTGNIGSVVSSTVNQSTQMKKSQVTKPNYRELIKQVHAIRNAEDELNLQIIKKTMNVDARLNRATVDSSSPLPLPSGKIWTRPPMSESNSPELINAHTNFAAINSSCRSDKVTDLSQPDHLAINTQKTMLNKALFGKKSSSSPLDLSMRTVKTKADSTDYKYQRLPFSSQTRQRSANANYMHALPRVEFTPNFSLHTAEVTQPQIIEKTRIVEHVFGEREASLQMKEDVTKHIPIIKPKIQHLSFLNQKPPSPNSLGLITPETKSKQALYETTTFSTQSELQAVSNSETMLKPLPTIAAKQTTRGCQEMWQVRPSVLETNPYATSKVFLNEQKATTRTLSTISVLPPDTSIMPLIKPLVLSDCVTTNQTLSRTDRADSLHIIPSSINNDNSKSMLETVQLATLNVDSITNSSSPRYGPDRTGLDDRKRFLEDYETADNSKPQVKQPRFEMATISTVVAGYRHKEIPVIAVNEKVIVKTIQEPTPLFHTQLNITIDECKKEPVSPTQHIYPTHVLPNIKSDTSSLIAARIRTKAELKGFTFIPPIAKTTETRLLKPSNQIKVEPIQAIENAIPSIPELNENFNNRSLLDFGWSSTCNNFVEQLLSNPQRPLARTRSKHADHSDENLPYVEREIKLQTIKVDNNSDTIMKRTNLLTNQRSSSLVDPVSYRFDSHIMNVDSMNSAAHDISSMSQSAVQKKISKVGRDKLRVHQERRFAARLQKGSSSESDIELDRRKTERLKKPLKKLAKSRIITRNIKNRFSDCGSDSSGSEAEKLNTQQINSKSKTEEDKQATQNSLCTQSAIRLQGDTETSNKNVLKITEVDLHSKKQITLHSSLSEHVSTSIVKDDIKLEFSIKAKHEKNHECDHDEPSTTKRVQIENEKIKKSKKDSEFTEHFKRQTNNQKIGQNTVTRSKRKRELELQLANSKVLRNEKIIRNSTATKKIKRKYTNKFTTPLNQDGVINDSHSKDMHNQLIMSTRLRSRTEKGKSNERKCLKKKKPNSQRAPNSGAVKTNTSTTTRNDGNSDLLMEVYRYKRSLKIPPSLITLKHPCNNKLKASLSDYETVTEIKKHHPNSQIQPPKTTKARMKSTEMERKLKQKTCLVAGGKKSKQTLLPEQPRSIIDVLHSRVLKSNSSKHPNTLTKKSGSHVSIIEHVNTTESHITTSVNSKLPTLKREKETDVNRKRHFSIFDTKVLQTKTRTESKLQQKREIIREIFVGEDRPASAPPEVTPSVENECMKMTYEQKYEQFLQQMNIVVNDTKFCKLSQKSLKYSSISRESTDVFRNFELSEIKQEEDTESASAIDVDEKAHVPADNVSITSTGPIQNNFKRKRSGKYFRRKGSSGFDYIRKKKKPSSVCSAASQHLYMSQKPYTKSDAEYKVKDKTEDDVCREIQKWVLNKGLGQSTMHKAARLGYIDVIVYCLDRLCMNPDLKDNAGYTPLHEACTNGWLEIAKLLLQYGAKHSEAAHSGIRPLHEASDNDHEEIVRLLLSYGADPLLATYSGQTPLMLASNAAVRDLLRNHLHDVQHVGTDRKPWQFEGPWKIFDATESGCDVLNGAPSNNCDMSRALCRNFGSNLTLSKTQFNQYEGKSSTVVLNKDTDLFDNNFSLDSIRLFNDDKPEVLVDGNSDMNSDSGIFEFEEADVLLPPLYLLSDEGTQKWVLLSDLCNLLKVKSKDTLLNKIYPSSSVSPVHKSHIKELKMSDFLKKATCLQLLCAGEKINICASKVVLIKYNENVRDLLGVKTILMKF